MFYIYTYTIYIVCSALVVDVKVVVVFVSLDLVNTFCLPPTLMANATSFVVGCCTTRRW